ncbi:MAG: hypothetical protein ACTSU3_06280 [Candidatus Thorarchaeota archaeon]
MDNTIEGKIISKQLGVFGSKQTIYGYLGIETSSGQQRTVKVDAFTWYETLEIGSQVIVEIATLGTTDIIVAQKIRFNQELMTNTDSVSGAIATA